MQNTHILNITLIYWKLFTITFLSLSLSLSLCMYVSELSPWRGHTLCQTQSFLLNKIHLNQSTICGYTFVLLYWLYWYLLDAHQGVHFTLFYAGYSDNFCDEGMHLVVWFLTCSSLLLSYSCRNLQVLVRVARFYTFHTWHTSVQSPALPWWPFVWHLQSMEQQISSVTWKGTDRDTEM